MRRVYLFSVGMLLGIGLCMIPGCSTFAGMARDVEAMSRGIAEALYRDTERQ